MGNDLYTQISHLSRMGNVELQPHPFVQRQYTYVSADPQLFIRYFECEDHSTAHVYYECRPVYLATRSNEGSMSIKEHCNGEWEEKISSLLNVVAS